MTGDPNYPCSVCGKPGLPVGSGPVTTDFRCLEHDEPPLGFNPFFILSQLIAIAAILGGLWCLWLLLRPAPQLEGVSWHLAQHPPFAILRLSVMAALWGAGLILPPALLRERLGKKCQMPADALFVLFLAFSGAAYLALARGEALRIGLTPLEVHVQRPFPLRRAGFPLGEVSRLDLEFRPHRGLRRNALRKAGWILGITRTDGPRFEAVFDQGPGARLAGEAVARACGTPLVEKEP